MGERDYRRERQNPLPKPAVFLNVNVPPKRTLEARPHWHFHQGTYVSGSFTFLAIQY